MVEDAARAELDAWLAQRDVVDAAVELVDTRQIEAEDVRVDEVEGQIALLHAVLDLRGPHAVTIWLPLMLGVRSDTGRDAIAAMVEHLWRDRSQAAGEVLDAIAAVHPDKPVTKAARKALFKLRSAGS
jgi:hypothetical protein